MRHIGRGPAVRVLARAVPAHDVVPGGEQARDDPGPRRAEPDEADTEGEPIVAGCEPFVHCRPNGIDL